MEPTKATRNFEILETPFLLCHIAQFIMFVEVDVYKRHGIKAPIFTKLSKHKQLALGSTVPANIVNPRLEVYLVEHKPPKWWEDEE